MNVTRFNLDTTAMLVEFNSSVWTARKLDKSTTDEVIRDKHARAKDAARVNKHLLAGRNELESIQKIVGAARTYVYTQTLPWSDNGLRLLPAVKFMDFNKRMSEFADEFSQAVDSFVNIYPTLITAQAMQLGEMFNRNDYPSASIIRDKFDFRLNFMPVPTAGDFRVDVGNDAENELRKQFEKMAQERVEAAHRDLWERLREHVTRMSDRLATDVIAGEEKPRKFHDTLVTGGLELCDLMKTLNLGADPDLEATRSDLANILRNAESADELRKNMHTRRETKQRVDEIIKKFGW